MIRYAAPLMMSAALIALPSFAGAQDQTVNIYNWSDYIGETSLEDFTAATGIAVNYDVYDSNEVLEAKLFAGNTGYDVVVPTAQPQLARQIEAGLHQKLDKSKIPNLANLDPVLMERVALADPGNEHAAIYQWGTNGFGYNTAMIAERMPDAPVGSWDMIFDPDVVAKFADCGVTMFDSPSEVIPVALNYLGHPPLSEDPAHLAEVEALLLSIRPHIKYFHSSQYINDLANGDVCVAMGFSGDIIQAQARATEAENGNDIRYVIAEEGTVVWFDTLVIPVDAPNPDAAHAFINFMLEPQNIAAVTNFVAYANAVPASLEFVDPAISGDPQIYPTAEIQQKLFSLQPVSADYERARTRLWTTVKAGR